MKMDENEKIEILGEITTWKEIKKTFKKIRNRRSKMRVNRELIKVVLREIVDELLLDKDDEIVYGKREKDNLYEIVILIEDLKYLLKR